ncbi:MAG: type IV toxin-antitoxin system AbiEi family antitoxin domain-containing protein [Acidimicrobiales bacterium]
METERQLGRLARRQHGLVTLAQAIDAGLSPAGVQWRARVGRWNRVAPGVFALAGTAVTWRQRTMAAVLAAGPGAVASHTTAAALYGLSRCPFKGVEITVPTGRSRRSSLGLVHGSVHLDRLDVARIDSVPVTRPARTLVDLAGAVEKAVLEEALDDALIRRLTTLDRLRQRAQALGASGRNGTRLLREELAAWAEGDLVEEVAEMRMIRRLVANGQPKPVLQHEVSDGNGRFVARLDAAYPEERVGLEMNGFRWHGTPRAFARDPARLRRLAAMGWLILPCTPVDLAGAGTELAEQVAGARAHSRAVRKGA